MPSFKENTFHSILGYAIGMECDRPIRCCPPACGQLAAQRLDEYILLGPKNANGKDSGVSDAREILVRAPQAFQSLLRTVATFGLARAKPWNPELLQVFVTEKSPTRDRRAVWSRGLPEVKPHGTPWTHWTGVEVKGSFPVSGRFLPRLQQMDEYGNTVAIDNSRSVAWRCVFPGEHPWENRQSWQDICDRKVSAHDRGTLDQGNALGQGSGQLWPRARQRAGSQRDAVTKPEH
jgi:hypothetical protein